MPEDKETGASALRSTLKLKNQQRSGKRQSVTKTLNIMNASPPVSVADVSFYVSKLEKLEICLLNLDSEIEACMVDDGIGIEFWEEHFEACETYQDSIGRALGHLRAVRTGASPNSDAGVPGSGRSGGALPKLKLPQVDLPKFDGKPENFERFMDSLEKLLSKFNLTQFEKYTYLLAQVSGSARQIVQSVPLGDQSYDVAKKLLSDAYSCKINQQYSVIRKLVEINLDSSKDPFSWISESRVLVQQLERLDISRDIFAQYFLWNSLPDDFKQQYMSITNESKPNLNQILENSFKVVERINERSKENKRKSAMFHGRSEQKESKTITMATSVNYGSPDVKTANQTGCWLCRAAGGPQTPGHKVSACPRFPTPETKLKFLNSNKGCVRCGFLNHQVDNCKFSLNRNCGECGGSHVFYLCTGKKEKTISKFKKPDPPKYNSNNKSSKVNTNVVEFNSMNINDSSGIVPSPENNYNDESSKVATNVVEFNSMNINNSNGIVLPSFTLNLPGEGGKFDARCMYDPASQTSFITDSAAAKLKCKILDPNLTMKVSGFNETKIYKSRMLEVQVVLNGKERKIKAAVVPEIKSKINSSQFEKICIEFKKQKIVLADKYLNDSVLGGRVDMLLGVDSAHVLPVQSCSFGPSHKLSLLYFTSCGVMLAGNMSHLVDNFNQLHLVKDFILKINSLS